MRDPQSSQQNKAESVGSEGRWNRNTPNIWLPESHRFALTELLYVLNVLWSDTKQSTSFSEVSFLRSSSTISLFDAVRPWWPLILLACWPDSQGQRARSLKWLLRKQLWWGYFAMERESMPMQLLQLFIFKKVPFECLMTIITKDYLFSVENMRDAYLWHTLHHNDLNVAVWFLGYSSWFLVVV